MDLVITAQLLGNFGEFAGAIAVVGTLIYLGVQVRQSRASMDANTEALDEGRRLTRNEILHQLSHRFEMARYRATENESIAALFTRGNADPDGLSQAEWAIFENRLVPYFQVHLMFYNAVQEGFAGPEILEFVDQDLRDNWGCTKGARRYWAEYQHLYPHRDHVNALFGNRDQA